MEENEKNARKVEKRMKRLSIATSIIGIFGVCGIAYATIVPQEWKTNITNFISNYFGTSYEETDYDGGVQDKTANSIISSNVENPEKYSQLLNADVYGIGDSNSGTLIESNYDQYNFNKEYDEEDERKLEKYTDSIQIKMGIINYGVLEKFDVENTVVDDEGHVISRPEATIEQDLEYQSEEFKNNWDNYYYNEEPFEEQLYFKITGLTIMNGNNFSEEDYYNYSRAKKIKVIFNNEKEEIINLIDSDEAQFIDLDYIQNDISKPVNIKIEILETFDGDNSDDIYLADVQFGMTSNIPAGR